MLGTPAYMAPEQARGEVESLDERCDVFALGALLCEILTGRPPYVGTRDEVLHQAQDGEPGRRLRPPGGLRGRRGVAGPRQELPRPARRPDPATRARSARAITAYLASADERARAAEHAAAAARAVAASERRARRLTVAAAGAILAALADRRRRLPLGDARAGPRRGGGTAPSRAVAAEQELRAGIEGVLEILFATEQKGQFLILQAAGADGRDAARWADLLETCRTVAERSRRPPRMRRPAGVPSTSPTGSGPRRPSFAVAGAAPAGLAIRIAAREMTRENRATREPGSEADPRLRLTGGPSMRFLKTLARPDPRHGASPPRRPGRRRHRRVLRRRSPTTWSSTSGARSWR